MANPLRFARVMITGVRQPIERSPADAGLAYEDVMFPATDEVTLKGWLVPAGPDPAPVVIWVHGWPWNRHGNVTGRVPWKDRSVDFLPATRALHDAGFAVLLFDLANHGESGGRPPLTYGPWESRDFAGAVDYVRSRPDVDGARVGTIGTSAGGSTALYGSAFVAASGRAPIRAILAIQPTKVSIFSESLVKSVFGWIGPLLFRSTDVIYWLLRAPLPTRHDPSVPAAELGSTVVQYVQGTGDPWGTMADVQRMSDATPGSIGVIAYPSEDRYSGYQYINTETDDVVRFFTTHL